MIPRAPPPPPGSPRPSGRRPAAWTPPGVSPSRRRRKSSPAARSASIVRSSAGLITTRWSNRGDPVRMLLACRRRALGRRWWAGRPARASEVAHRPAHDPAPLAVDRRARSARCRPRSRGRPRGSPRRSSARAGRPRSARPRSADPADHARRFSLMGAIVARAPLRVALGGGGTDLPSYYREHGGFVVSTAIDRYVHMLVSADFQARYRLKHLEWEEADDPVRGAPPDPARGARRATGTGRRWSWRPWPTPRREPGWAPRGPTRCAPSRRCARRRARSRWRAPSSRRPPARSRSTCSAGAWASRTSTPPRFGGVRAYTFHRDDSVDVRLLSLPEHVERALRDDFLLFFTGRERSASDVLSGQVSATASGDDGGAPRSRPAARAGPLDLRGARGGRPGALRRADERPVGGQARPRSRHGDRGDGRAARAGARRRRARRGVARRRRRRVRARLHAGPGAHPRASSRTCASCASAPDPHGCVAQATPFPGAAGRIRVFAP